MKIEGFFKPVGEYPKDVLRQKAREHALESGVALEEALSLEEQGWALVQFEGCRITAVLSHMCGCEFCKKSKTFVEYWSDIASAKRRVENFGFDDDLWYEEDLRIEALYFEGYVKQDPVEALELFQSCERIKGHLNEIEELKA